MPNESVHHVTTAQKTLKILLVEDDPVIMENTCEMLKIFGYEVVEASTGDVALKILRSTVIEVLISDINLPGLSGNDLATQARELYPDIHIIFASGETVFSPISDAKILRKPYDSLSIAAALQSLSIKKILEKGR